MRVLVIALLFLSLVFSTFSSSAWESFCEYEGEDCDGPGAARARWIDPSGLRDEHRQIWTRAVADAGLPESIACDSGSDDCSAYLPVFTVRSDYKENGRSFGPSLNPLELFAPNAGYPGPVQYFEDLQVRKASVGELTQLPDEAYSIEDWSNGLERCPIDDQLPAIPCHEFETHLGPLNSNHFLPQAKRFYEHYHDLAILRSTECERWLAAFENASGSIGGSEAPAARFDRTMQSGRFSRFVQQCTQAALTYEAVAQHYLQDAWSVGHMWERWGSANPAYFGPVIGEKFAKARLVAATAGMIHGARSMLDDLFADVPPPLAPPYHDAMCSPDLQVLWTSSEGSASAGVGDLYLSALTDPFSLLGDPAFASFDDDPDWLSSLTYQGDRLRRCAMSSLADVYAQSGNVLGDPTGPSAFQMLSELEILNTCFSQRVTNRAIQAGARVPIPAVGPVSLSNLAVSSLVLLNFGIYPYYPFSGLASSFQKSLQDIASEIQDLEAHPPDGTSLAEGGLSDMLGIQRNGHVELNVDPDIIPYVDRNPDETSAIARVFHRGFADLHCSSTSEADLGFAKQRIAALQEAAESGDLDAKSAIPAACGVCTEFARRHVRRQTGATTAEYDVNREPLCAFLADDPEYVYQPGAESATEIELAAAWCGCDGYQLELMVLTGGSGPSFVNLQTSINDDGAIAFSGADASGNRGFITSAPGQYQAITSIVSSSRTFSGGALNSTGPVASAVFRERVSGAPPQFVVRKWTIDGSSSTILGSSSGASGFPIDFDSASVFLDINNLGVGAFTGLVSGSTQLALFSSNERPATQLATFPSSTVVRPQIANTNEIVIRDAFGAVVLYPASPGLPPLVVADAPAITNAGSHPGISSDGSVVAFIGSDGTGEQVFVALRDPGGPESGVVVPIASTEPDQLFSDFNGDERVGVSSVDDPATEQLDQIVTVVFEATMGDQTSVFAIEVARAPNEETVIGPPKRVLGPGDEVGGQTVMTTSLYDPVNSTGDIAVLATFASGASGIVRARPVSPSVPAELFAHQ